jgi:ribosomal-protein-alanine N-acetyltransferase
VKLRQNGPVDSGVTIRPVRADDLALLGRLLLDPTASGEFEWFGYGANRLKELQRRWEQDGLIGEESFLAVALRDDTCIGWVNWRPGRFGSCEIGIALLPEHRGQGHGSEAQCQLVDYLFSNLPVHRLEASTEADNIAEQRALERVGFRQEGVRRDGRFRNGQWRDGVLYGLLRSDPR